MLVDRDVTATLEHPQPAAGDQARCLGEELPAVPVVRAADQDQRRCADRRSGTPPGRTRPPLRSSWPWRPDRLRWGAGAAGPASRGPRRRAARVGAGRCPSSSRRAPAGGRRGGCGRPLGAGGLALAARSGRRCSAARGDRRHRGGRRPTAGRCCRRSRCRRRPPARRSASGSRRRAPPPVRPSTCRAAALSCG